MENRLPYAYTDEPTTSSTSTTAIRSTTVATAVLTPADHNDIVDRASIVVWIGIYTFLAIFLLIVVLLLFYPRTGLSFTLSIVEMAVAFVVAVIAVWLATQSLLAINIFRAVAIIFVLVMIVIVILQFISFINFLTTDTTDPVTTVLINLLRVTFTVGVALLFLGLAISFFVTASHYVTALKRKDVLENEYVVEEDVETPQPYAAAEPSAPALSKVRHRSPFGVDIGK